MALFTLDWMDGEYTYYVELTEAQVEALANALISYQQEIYQQEMDPEDLKDEVNEDVEKYVKGAEELCLFPGNGEEHGFYDFIDYSSIVGNAIPEILPDMYKSMKAANPGLYYNVDKERPESDDVSSLDDILDDIEKLGELCADGSLMQFRHLPEEVYVKARQIVDSEWTKVN